MINLYCFVVGNNQEEFRIKIAGEECVEDLKEKIIAHLGYDGPTSTLKLYSAKKGNQWVSSKDSVLVELKKSNIESYVAESFTLMEAPDPLSDYIESNTLSNRQINVFVIIQNKRMRVDDVPEITKLESLPQIQVEEKYVMLPATFLALCGYDALDALDDLMLYRREQMNDLWSFLEDNVVAKNAKGFIVGPPGTGKSVTTLSFVASLDHNEWNVVWIHLSTCVDTCLVMGTNEYWEIDNLLNFKLPRVDGKKLLICLDGYKATTQHQELFKRILTKLDKKNERLIVCSSMATLGKRNQQDDDKFKIQVFYMHSWTKEDYIAAVADQTFYENIELNLDATSTSEVNEDDIFVGKEEDKKMYALDLKYYYAGGSCRFMFQYPTKKVKHLLKLGLKCAKNKSKLVAYCGGEFHIDAINRLFGMQPNGDDTDNYRFPVSSYATSLFAEECSEKTIAKLVSCLNMSKNPSVDGHLFEWLFFASVPKRAVNLSGGQTIETLPKASVLTFDPKKRFKVLHDGKIKGDCYWLQPNAWNQGGYDALYFNTEDGKVIFVQVTRSNRHDFKLRFFAEVLFKLKQAKMVITNVIIYFVVKPTKYLNFQLTCIEDRGVLQEYDPSWTNLEENEVRVRAFEDAPSL
ncbi:crinkler (CRN) family protein [Thraustotheca clavata]|uniref:Crinkler (CRN) family protein n=1 Tax=Thraustotheca clavata TaxID=74557 RepID=A0A1V9ZW46_9STRA|nr:crinkler (CRN) family protein [Thraustotheca clavata]